MNNYIIRPQEIYLLECYSSPAYFKEMRDAFANMLEASEYALELFVNDLPFDYRTRPINRQPDIVWGERVLPNLRSTLDGLNVGYQELLKGDLAAIRYGGNVKSDFRATVWIMISTGCQSSNSWIIINGRDRQAYVPLTWE